LPDPVSSPRTQAKSAGRALDILEELAREQDGLTFTELQQHLALPKSSLHELLSVLVDRSYVKADGTTRRYRLGTRVWEVGQAYIQHRHIVDEARPAMNDIVALLNETVQLSVLDGLENVYLAKVDCSHPLRLQTDVGKRFPAHATAVGKVLLAHVPSQDLARRLREQPLPRLTEQTITDPDRLAADLARVRSQGFAADWEEGMAGLRCVAVPIRDHRGVLAAMSASIPVARATPSQMATALRLLAKESLQVSRQLGSTTDDAEISRLLTLSDDQLSDLIEQRRQPQASAAVPLAVSDAG
jgi:DNA-binding IclR family transcriptional regulator